MQISRRDGKGADAPGASKSYTSSVSQRFHQHCNEADVLELLAAQNLTKKSINSSRP